MMFTKYRMKVALALLISMLFAILIDMYRMPTTGMATTADVQSEVDIQVYLAITASNNLTTDGIKFNISALPAIDVNSTGSYGDAGARENMTEQFINVSTDSNVDVDICIKANANLTSGANVITINNYKWINASSNNLTDPDFDLRISFNATYYPASAPLDAGNAAYYRFWLNVSGGQQAGVYNNTINFKGVQTTVGCA
jgi:hypothetical protein